MIRKSSDIKRPRLGFIELFKQSSNGCLLRCIVYREYRFCDHTLGFKPSRLTGAGSTDVSVGAEDRHRSSAC